MPKLRKRYFALSACAVMAVLLVAHRQILPYAVRWLDIGEAPVKSDAVFVLFGNNDTRPYVAAALYNAGYANEILMASFNPTVSSKQEYPGHEIYRRVFLNRGVPQDRIHILGEQITNTMNESAVLGEYLDLHPAATVTVVTSHYHTRRTRWSFRLHFGSGAKRLRYVSAPEDDFSADDWWLYPKGFEMVGMEYIKIVGYWVMYGRGLWWFGGMAFCLVGWSVYRRRTVPGETPDGALEDSSA